MRGRDIISSTIPSAPEHTSMSLKSSHPVTELLVRWRSAAASQNVELVSGPARCATAAGVQGQAFTRELGPRNRF